MVDSNISLWELRNIVRSLRKLNIMDTEQAFQLK